MSEMTERTTDFSAELETLRRVNGELKDKASARKKRISELEATVSDLQTKLTATNASLRQVTVDGPLKAMANDISTCGELWLEQFAKSYQVEMVDGKLTLHDLEGKPVTVEGQPVAFERDALVELVTNEAHPNAKAFRAITGVSKASGAGGRVSDRLAIRTQPSTPQALQLGLR